MTTFSYKKGKKCLVQTTTCSSGKEFKKMIKIRDTLEWSFYETKESACFGLRSRKHYILQPKKRILVSTGVYIDKMDADLHGQMNSKSVIAYKYGVVVFNAPGIIDADYKDEIKVLPYNYSEEDYIIKRGNAVAHMQITKMLSLQQQKALQ
ncbi:deoxyuridine 5'-triphosphate nucleotidohydrolase-like [Hydra vulgaris]|uniref:Deoxyuridine 5'-triphosphate nucleotidohydrolase n=1 Tax=Hydra vulgaris TaxID=6087 RepID=A0ABM4DHA2_HYDVU